MTPRPGTCSNDIECGINGKCFSSKCYENPDDSCKPYGSAGERPITFESAFNLNRTYAPDEMADGTCNPNPTCSNSKNTYDITKTAGRYLLQSATCGTGECSWTMDAQSKDCWRYNGRNIPPDVVELGEPEMYPHYCNLPAGETSFFTQYATCTATGAIPARTVKCELNRTSKADPDNDDTGNMCEACADPTNAAQKMYGAWTGRTCCGDDIGEGGFAYGNYGIPAAHSASTAPPGREGTEVCDDYYGADKTVEAKWIDNDCDTKKACRDNDCWSRDYRTLRDTDEGWVEFLNPTGGLCCNRAGSGKANCKNFLDPFAATDNGVDCAASYTCDCKPVGITTPGGTPKIHGTIILTPPTTVVKTCVPTYDELLLSDSLNDRKFQIAGGGSHTFELYAYDIDGSGDECGTITEPKDRVKLIFNDGVTTLDPLYNPRTTDVFTSFHFQNTAVVDCLVEVRIT